MSGGMNDNSNASLLFLMTSRELSAVISTSADFSFDIVSEIAIMSTGVNMPEIT